MIFRSSYHFLFMFRICQYHQNTDINISFQVFYSLRLHEFFYQILQYYFILLIWLRICVPITFFNEILGIFISVNIYFIFKETIIHVIIKLFINISSVLSCFLNLLNFWYFHLHNVINKIFRSTFPSVKYLSITVDKLIQLILIVSNMKSTNFDSKIMDS